MKNKTILVTGGAGYIGSHTCIELLKANYEVVVVDNLSNSSLESIKRVEILTSRRILFYQEDIKNKRAIHRIFVENEIDAVIHFAGDKSAGESIDLPLRYYSNNVGATLSLLEVMIENSCNKIVFSSSAAVYGNPEKLPIKEDSALLALNPYAQSKLIIEQVLKDMHVSNDISIAILRYFNPIGAHKSGMIGESPLGTPNNLVPYISQVAVRKRKFVKVFGGDYNTIDGTGVRDFIHVVDLANGHVKALNSIMSMPKLLVSNLGTGRGYSVLQVIKEFERASGKNIPFTIMPRRDGDVAESFSDPKYAEYMLGWKAKYDLKRMCKDAWLWQKKNPDGY